MNQDQIQRINGAVNDLRSTLVEISQARNLFTALHLLGGNTAMESDVVARLGEWLLTKADEDLSAVITSIEDLGEGEPA